MGGEMRKEQEECVCGNINNILCEKKKSTFNKRKNKQTWPNASLYVSLIPVVVTIWCPPMTTATEFSGNRLWQSMVKWVSTLHRGLRKSSHSAFPPYSFHVLYNKAQPWRLPLLLSLSKSPHLDIKAWKPELSDKQLERSCNGKLIWLSLCSLLNFKHFLSSQQCFVFVCSWGYPWTPALHLPKC